MTDRPSVAVQELDTLREEISERMRAGQLKLPGLPDIAIRVRQVIDRTNYSTAELARVIQSDIPLTARLIQVANCPLYKSAQPVEHVHAAINRLGANVVKSLVTSFALRRVYAAKSKVTNRLAERSWKHSLQVATLAFALARVTPRLDPEHVMLAALVHDIGLLPVLAYAETDTTLQQAESRLQEVVDHCRVQLGVDVLKMWRFDDEFADVVRNAENWNYDHPGVANNSDVVIIAQLLASKLAGEGQDLPEPESLPAHGKFPLFKLGRAAYLELIAEAKDEMAELTRLLSVA
ncbi:MAG: HDOD domain-containing protein [Gammaproteobacteria bacterium]|nr:HDOD domain-containing protein [Gammaproteobacteria bacterium]